METVVKISVRKLITLWFVAAILASLVGCGGSDSKSEKDDDDTRSVMVASGELTGPEGATATITIELYNPEGKLIGAGLAEDVASLYNIFADMADGDFKEGRTVTFGTTYVATIFDVASGFECAFALGDGTGTYNDNYDAYDLDIICSQLTDLEIIISNANESVEQVNEAVGFAVTATGGTPPYSYNWSLPGSSTPTSTEQSLNVTYDSTGTKDVSVEVTDDAGAKVTQAITIQVTDSVNLDVGVGTVRQITKTPTDFPESDATLGGILFLGRTGMKNIDIGPALPSLGTQQLAGQIFDLGVAATPAGAEPAVIYSSYNDGLRLTRFNSTSELFEAPTVLTGDTGFSARATDIHMYNEDPTAGALVTIAGEVRRFNYSVANDTYEVGTVYEAAEFPNGSASPRSAVTRGANSSLLVTSLSDLWIHDGIDGNAATFIATLGTAAQALDCSDEICVSCDSSEDKCSVIHWDSLDNVSVTDTFTTGNGPHSCDLLALNNGDVACASVCGSAICYTTAVIDGTNGTVKSTEIKTNLPSFCLSPEDVQFMENDTTNVLFTCLDSNNATIVDTGISNP